MKVIFSAAFACSLLFAGQSFAGSTGTDHAPLQLSPTQMDRITAGVGANNVAVAPWDALLDVGFTLNHNNSSNPGTTDNSTNKIGGVAVPSAVPNSVCIAFCP